MELTVDTRTRPPHPPRRRPRLLQANRITQLGVIETFLAIALTFVELSELADGGPPITAVFAVLTLILIASAARFPVAASMLSLMIVLCAFAANDIVPLYWIFFTTLLVEVVTASGQIALGAVLALAHWLLSAVDPHAGAVSTDIMALSIVGALHVAAFLVGWSRASRGRQQKKLRASLAAQERQQRIDLARELHDSVATSLTSVVMQAQALTLVSANDDDSDDAQLREGLETISDSSREALSNLRTMLQLLNEKPNRASFRARAGSPPLNLAMARVQQELEAHSMEAYITIDLPPDVAASLNSPDPYGLTGPGADPWIDRDTVIKVLTEMTSNAAKHSPRHSTVELSCSVEDGHFVVSMTNPRLEKHQNSHDDLMSGGMGVRSMRARAAKAGGDLETDLSTSPTGVAPAAPVKADGAGGGGVSFWRTTLRLPIVVTKY